jgi:hypothetical protein
MRGIQTMTNKGSSYRQETEVIGRHMGSGRPDSECGLRRFWQSPNGREVARLARGWREPMEREVEEGGSCCVVTQGRQVSEVPESLEGGWVMDLSWRTGKTESGQRTLHQSRYTVVTPIE